MAALWPRPFLCVCLLLYWIHGPWGSAFPWCRCSPSSRPAPAPSAIPSLLGRHLPWPAVAPWCSSPTSDCARLPAPWSRQDPCRARPYAHVFLHAASSNRGVPSSLQLAGRVSPSRSDPAVNVQSCVLFPQLGSRQPPFSNLCLGRHRGVLVDRLVVDLADVVEPSNFVLPCSISSNHESQTLDKNKQGPCASLIKYSVEDFNPRSSLFRASSRNPKDRMKTKLAARYSPNARQIA